MPGIETATQSPPSPKLYTTRSTCRVCGRGNLVPLFSLGEQYVSDFVEKDKVLAGVKAPIELVLCNNCTLVQNPHTAPQELLYTRHYWYRSGVTETMRKALRNVTAAIEEIVSLNEDDVVLDIGSNDGTLLRSYTKDVWKIGVEPAKNLAEEGSIGLDAFIEDFWSYEVWQERFEELIDNPKVITALGMFYDLEDPNQFVADVARVLAPDGLFVAQLMCLKNMLAINDLGNLAHEHLEFYSLKSLHYLFNKHGLEIFDIETNMVNGESYRLYIRHQGSDTPNTSGGTKRIEKATMEEEFLDNPNIYSDLYTKMENNRTAVTSFIKDMVAIGKRVWVYGASTKGNVLLQYYGLDSTLIEGAADRSPEKAGKFTIGTGIPIFSEELARKCKPDFFLVLPYAFLPEFLSREREWINGGGKFIVPLPKMRIVP